MENLMEKEAYGLWMEEGMWEALKGGILKGLGPWLQLIIIMFKNSILGNGNKEN